MQSGAYREGLWTSGPRNRMIQEYDNDENESCNLTLKFSGLAIA